MLAAWMDGWPRGTIHYPSLGDVWIEQAAAEYILNNAISSIVHSTSSKELSKRRGRFWLLIYPAKYEDIIPIVLVDTVSSNLYFFNVCWPPRMWKFVNVCTRYLKVMTSKHHIFSQKCDPWGVTFFFIGVLFRGKGARPTGICNNRLGIFHTRAGVC